MLPYKISERITPENILTLEKGEVFVFGSNEAGIHGAGAADYANRNLGATWGLGFGPSGATFAIPTKDWLIRKLPEIYIDFYVKRFIAFAGKHPNTKFFVTQIGCGLAGYTPTDIAPMFEEAVDMPNIFLPLCFWEVLVEDYFGQVQSS